MATKRYPSFSCSFCSRNSLFSSTSFFRSRALRMAISSSASSKGLISLWPLSAWPDDGASFADAGQHNDGGVLLDLTKAFESLQAVDNRHQDVQQNQAGEICRENSMASLPLARVLTSYPFNLRRVFIISNPIFIIYH